MALENKGNVSGSGSGYSLRKRTSRHQNLNEETMSKQRLDSDSDSDSPGQKSRSDKKNSRHSENPESTSSSKFDIASLSIKIKCEDPKRDLSHGSKICNKQYTNRRYLNRHVVAIHESQTQNGLKKYSCTICGNQFAQEAYLKRHMKIMHLPGSRRPVAVKCSQCSLRFKDSKSKARHFCTSNNKIQSVNELPRIEIRTGLVDSARIPRMSSTKFPCELCDLSFARADTHKNHMNVHSGKTFKCPQCESSFLQKNSLRAHVSRVHEKDFSYTTNKPVQCQYCPLIFIGKSNRDLHERRAHTFAKPFGCPICPERFVDPSEVKYHVMFHTGERPHKCTVPGCDKSYTRSSHLLQHKRTHTGERPYACRLCESSFRTSTHCIRHEQEIHSFFEPRPPLRVIRKPRPVVPKMSAQASRHTSKKSKLAKNHVQERSYLCDQCGKGFFTASHCRRHEKEVHRRKKAAVKIHTEPQTTSMTETAGNDTTKQRNPTIPGSPTKNITITGMGKGNIVLEEVDIKNEPNDVITLCDTPVPFKCDPDQSVTKLEPEFMEPAGNADVVNLKGTSSSTILYCPYCYIAAGSYAELEQHASETHSDSPSTAGSSTFKCPHLYCSKKFKSIQILEAHQRDFHKLNMR